MTDVEFLRGDDLSRLEAEKLQVHETIIERGLKTFIEVANALLEIRKDRLYRDYGSFENYCRERWGFSRGHVYRLIDAAKVTQVLSPIGDMPANEAQARELVPLLDQPEQLREAWETASGDGKPTAAKVRSAVESKTAVVDRRDEVDVDRRDEVDPGREDWRAAWGHRATTTNSGITRHIHSLIVELWWLGELEWPLAECAPKKMYREKRYRPDHWDDRDEHDHLVQMMDDAVRFLNAIRDKFA